MLRRIVKILKRSPLKNEILQRHMKEIYPNRFNVIHDCKTRRSSLSTCLQNNLNQVTNPKSIARTHD